jgi:putative IMPACT (imprinted ancient) family translation regulator
MSEHDNSQFEAIAITPGINENDEGDMLELQAVIDSISQGKTKMFKKAKFQAFSAAISHEDHVMKVQDHLSMINNKSTNTIIAYRVIDQNSNTGISEGYDDDGEEGSGEKLLRLLQKMGIENIVVVV